MPFVFRVENEKGNGCYTRGGVEANDLTSHESCDVHPSPSTDKIIQRYAKDNERCGFLNMEQAKAWFTHDEFIKLEQNGFTLKRLEVKEITVEGDKQILFIR